VSLLQRVVIVMQDVFRKIATISKIHCTGEAQGMTSRKLECLTCGTSFGQGRAFNKHVSYCCAIAHASTNRNKDVSSSERSASDGTDGEQNASNGSCFFILFKVPLQNIGSPILLQPLPGL
jgi:hypothetical protein